MRLSRFRLRVLRRVAPPWLLAALLASSTGATVWHLTASAERSRRAWGDLVEAVVATRAVAAGDRLDAGNTARRAVPRVAVAADTLTELPAGATIARVDLAVAEPVRAARVTAAGLAGPGSRVVALPATAVSPTVRPGDRVDVYGRATTPVATDAVVVAATAERTDVAVDAATAGAVVAAITDGAVALVARA